MADEGSRWIEELSEKVKGLPWEANGNQKKTKVVSMDGTGDIAVKPEVAEREALVKRAYKQR